MLFRISLYWIPFYIYRVMAVDLVTFYIGEPVTIFVLPHCLAQDWFRFEGPLKTPLSKDDPRISFNTTVLIIEDGREEDSGRYGCSTFTIDVKVIGYHFGLVNLSIKDEAINLREGEELEVNCSVESYPNVSMIWTTPRVTFTNDNTSAESLIVRNSGCEDGGEYTLTLLHPVLRITFIKKFFVVIHCFPRIDPRKSFKTSVTFEPGQPFSLRADVIASPPPEFSWRKQSSNGLVSLPDSNRVRQTDTNWSSTLTIMSTTREDSGSYLLEVENGMGKPMEIWYAVNVTEPGTPSGPDLTTIGIGIGSGVGVLLIIIIVAVIIYRSKKTAEKPKSIEELGERNKRRRELPVKTGKQNTEPRYSNSSGVTSPKHYEGLNRKNQPPQETYGDLDNQDIYYNE